ncbi:unnamed protein product [Psylliodes chrysocephalus]|uniref:Uncharacterized protein n=1 Tax=Psylliodes chrysocephalus TaxID=3402493 RepID=A0A9P0CE15_9CUCU|nr:unnamed protein product [Psylliodes chrysocephala]
MRYSVFFFLAVLATASALSDHGEWTHFKKTHGKFYKNSVEESFRFSVFQSNLRRIEEHNAKFEQGLSSFKMGMNMFGDLTGDEFLERQKLSEMNRPIALARTKNFEDTIDNDDDVPDRIDWRTKGAVTEVKNQGNCGSCWSFSTTGALEGAYFLKTGKLVSLSEQNLVDCAKDDCYGCKGGWMGKAMEYAEKNGIMREDAYPYKEVASTECQFNVSESVLKPKEHIFVTNGSEDALKKAVARQPVAVAINAGHDFQFYSWGILDDSSCVSDSYHLNHGVLVVGYGIFNEKDYWIVKNSWGASYGKDGYVWMPRNKNNACGIAAYALYPVL